MARAGAAPPQPRTPSVSDAVVPVVALAALIAAALALFGLDALDGPLQVALILCCALAALIGLKNGHSWSAVQDAGQAALSSIASALFILLAVGALIGTWNLSGTIPTLVYYGIQVLSPGCFHVAAGLASQNLSRLAADSATVTSPLVPWNSCGAFMGAVLGVSTIAYLPFAFFNIASPALSVLYGFTGFKIVPADRVAETERTQ